MTRHEDEFDTMMEQVSKNKYIERGLVQITTTNNQCDPVVREMATAVLHEIEKAKRRREMNNCVGCVAIIVAIIFIVVITAVGGWSKGHYHH